MNKQNLFSESIAQNPVVEELRHKYPAVPDLYLEKWAMSDEAHLNSVEWKNLLNATDKVAQEASCICNRLAEETGRMSPERLNSEKKALLCALHKIEDLLEALDWSYPTVGQNRYSMARSLPALTGRIPEILVKSDDEVLIWMPRLSSRTAKMANSIGYKELQDLLHEESVMFPRFGQWHCDFFHVFNPSNMVGVKDVDNYAYKPVIDALARAFCTNDAYDNFSYSMFNYPSKNIKIGCYVHVYKRAKKVELFHDFEELALTALNPQNSLNP